MSEHRKTRASTTTEDKRLSQSQTLKIKLTQEKQNVEPVELVEIEEKEEMNSTNQSTGVKKKNPLKLTTETAKAKATNKTDEETKKPEAESSNPQNVASDKAPLLAPEKAPQKVANNVKATNIASPNKTLVVSKQREEKKEDPKPSSLQKEKNTI